MGNNAISCGISDGIYEPAGNSQIATYVDQKINSSRILMVSKSKCPACKRAKRLFNDVFQELGEWPTVVELDQYPMSTQTKIVDQLQTKSGIRTVPQIFFNGNFVGGNDDVQKLRRQRTLVMKFNTTSKSSSSGWKSKFPSVASPIKTNNIIRLSPVFMPTRASKIRTQPVLFKASQIQDYMATEYPVEQIQVSNFSLPPSAPTVSYTNYSTSRAKVEEKSDESWAQSVEVVQPSQYKSRYSSKAPSKGYSEIVSYQEAPKQVVEEVLSDSGDDGGFGNDEIVTTYDTDDDYDINPNQQFNQDAFDEVEEIIDENPEFAQGL